MPLDGAQAELVQRTRDANNALREALTTRAAALKAELLAINDFITSVESIGDEDLLEDAAETLVVYVEGARRPTDWIPRAEFLDPASPFYNDARRRQRYLSYATPRPLNDKEKQILLETVCNANKRVIAAHAQAQGFDPWVAVQQAVDTNAPFLTDNLEHLDWASIAADYSAAVYPLAERTAIECEVFWRDGLRPNINRGEWSDEEHMKLKALVAASPNDPPDWEDIAEKLGTGRVALDCMKCATFGPPGSAPPKIKSAAGIKVWTEEENARLLDAVKMHGTTNWQLVSMTMGDGFTGSQCDAHYRKLTQIQRRGPWTAEEDEALRSAVEVYPEDSVIPFKHVAKLIPGRSNVQCRDRWLIISGRRPGQRVTKRKWTKAEDDQLNEAVQQEIERLKERYQDDDVDVDDVNWKEVVKNLDTGRQIKHCKSRWRLLKKSETKRKGKGKATDADSEDEDSEDEEATTDSTGGEGEDAPPPAKITRLKRQAPGRRKPAAAVEVDDEADFTANEDTPVPRRRASTRRKSSRATDESAMDVDDPEPGPSTSAAAEAAQALVEMGSRKKKQTTKSTIGKRRSLAEVLGEDEQDDEDEDPARSGRMKKKNWSTEEDEKLLAVVADQSETSGRTNWTAVAKDMDGRTANGCSQRHRVLIAKQQKAGSQLGEAASGMDVDAPSTASNPVTKSPTTTTTTTATAPDAPLPSNAPAKRLPIVQRKSTRSTRFRASLAEADNSDVEVDQPEASEPVAAPPITPATSRRWTDEQDELLIALVIASEDPQQPNWKAISVDMPGRTAAACSSRYNVLKTKGKVPTHS